MMPLLMLLAGCAAPDVSELFHDAHAEIVDGDADVEAAFIDMVDGAERSLAVALPSEPSDPLAAALVQAVERGVDVRFTTDVDAAGPRVDALADAGAEVSLADGAVSYFDFAFNVDVSWTSEQVVMSHALVLADDTHALSASGYGGEDGPRLLWTLRGEDLGADLFWEHNQIMGGSDASSLTAYSSLAKSVADFRWAYPTTSDLQLEMWLGPQERLIKRVIDATYAARASVWVLTDDLSDEGLVTALQAKAADGFDVQVVVGAGFGEASASLSQRLELYAPSVERYQSEQRLPTLVLVDQRRDRIGRWNTARAMGLSHPIWSASRLYLGAEVQTDQLTDGNLFVLNDFGEPSGDLLDLVAFFESVRDASEPMP
ncbi:MAG: hypothetical protein H6741_24520 [Alphaproteobacteria bacterium]|nr:hypothetical protein [Alphaproteobacteria bacterium]